MRGSCQSAAHSAVSQSRRFARFASFARTTFTPFAAAYHSIHLPIPYSFPRSRSSLKQFQANFYTPCGGMNPRRRCANLLMNTQKAPSIFLYRKFRLVKVCEKVRE